MRYVMKVRYVGINQYSLGDCDYRRQHAALDSQLLHWLAESKRWEAEAVRLARELAAERAHAQNRPVLVSTSAYGPSPHDGEPAHHAIAMVGGGGGGGSNCAIAVAPFVLAAKDPDRWIMDLDALVGRRMERTFK